jgi:CPA1 family monovalent cation:H+ antiporter
MAETTAVVLGVLISFGIAIAVRLVTNRITLPYTVVLVAIGFLFTLADPQTYVGLDFTLDPLFTHDVILFVFLPAIVFQGAAETNYTAFRRDLPVFGTIVLVGLPIAVLLVGWLGSIVFGFPLLIALLFGAMAYPVDPVAVLSLFERAGAPERLAVLTEGESLLDDGLAIVVFGTILELVRQANPAELAGTALLSIGRFRGLAVEVLVVSAGGVLVGLLNGYLVYRFQRVTDDRLTLFLLTLTGAYGSFYLGEHLLGVSGILATVTTGLLIGTHGQRHAVIDERLTFLRDVWEAIVFLLNTVLFIAIGLQVSSEQILGVGQLVLVALVLLLAVRAGVVYGLTTLLNRVIKDPISLSYQHVMVWGGMHGVIPVALALSLGPTVPFRDQLQTMVFGVVVASMIVQGLLMPRVLRTTGVSESCRTSST